MRLGLLAAFLVSPAALAADLEKIDRTVGKEPKYAGTPTYCLLAFGADAKSRVWLVRDGGTLYVERNGNGDLTEANEAVTAPKPQPGDTDGAFTFDVGELAVGGKTHKGLRVRFSPPDGQHVDRRFGEPTSLTVTALDGFLPAGAGTAPGLERELRLDGSGLLRVDAVAAACDGDGVFAACHRYRQQWAVDVHVRPGAPAELVLDLRG